MWKFWKSDQESTYTRPGKICDKVIHLSQHGQLLAVQKRSDPEFKRTDQPLIPLNFFALAFDQQNKSTVYGPMDTFHEAVKSALDSDSSYAIFYLPSTDPHDAKHIILTWNKEEGYT